MLGYKLIFQDLDDDVAVKIFLQNISKYNGGLICSKCGTVRSYVKKWMDHEAICKGSDVCSKQIFFVQPVKITIFIINY